MLSLVASAAIQSTPVRRALVSREDQIDRLKRSGAESSDEFDLIVVGGGATGAGVALDAASRGLSVALIERDDFGAATSARSTKLLWAGSRYLVQALIRLVSPQLIMAPMETLTRFSSEFKMVMNCHRERSFLLNTQPHLTHWLPIAVPFDRWFIWPPPMNYPPAAVGPLGMFYSFFKFYDALSGFEAPPSHVMTKARTHRKFPQLDDRVKYCMVFYEGQHNDARTNVAIALTAAQKGAVVANYMEMTGVLTDENGKACGVTVKDLEGRKEFEVRGKAVMFCGGPFTDELRQRELASMGKLDDSFKKVVKGAGGIHVVLPGHLTPSHMGMVDMSTSDGRFLFFLPWLGHTVIGTTDSPIDKPKMRPEPSEVEIQWVLDEARKYLAPDVKLRRHDVLSAWCGIRPLANDPNASNTASVSRDHVISVNPDSGIIFVAGGKWTTYREMAEDAVNRVLKEHSFPHAGECNTLNVPLLGAEGYDRQLSTKLIQGYGLPADIADHLAHTYGGLSELVLSMVQPGKQDMDQLSLHRKGVHQYPRLMPGFPYLECEVSYAAKHECARRASDILGQRTRLAFLNVEAAREALPRVIELMAEELKWDKKRRKQEFNDAIEFLDTFGGPVPKGNALPAQFSDEVLRATFEALDDNGNGILEEEELLRFVKTVERDVDMAVVKKSIRQLTAAGTPVTLDVFIKWWRSGLMDQALQKALYSRVAATPEKLLGQTGVAFG